MSPWFDIHLSYLACSFHRWHCSAKQLTLRSLFVRHQYTIAVYFIRLRSVWSVLHQGSVGRVHEKILLNATYTLQAFCFVFHHKIWVFIISISSFDEVSNFRNRTLTNQKHELASRQCCALRILPPEPNVQLPVAKPYFNFLTKKGKNIDPATTKR